ncbi:AMP-binding protein [Micromonospora echinospora]
MLPIFTLVDLLEQRATDSGTEIAISSPGETLTYRDVAALAAGRAAVLHDLGVRRGDRVALLLPNCADAVSWFFGALGLGAVAVFVNDSLRQRQVSHIVRHSGATVAVTNRRLRPLLDGSDLDDRHIVDVTVAAAGRSVPPAPVVSRDLAALIYTSGSTGQPKGVMVTHGNLVAGARIVAAYLGLTAADRTLSVLPWSFDAGLNQVLATFWAGGRLVIAGSTYPPDVCRTLAAAGATGMAGVPPLWELLVNGRPGGLLRATLPELRYITNTGGPLRRETLGRIRQAHPHLDVYLMYGLTEAFRSTYLPPELVDDRAGSIGRAIPDTEILVVSPSGQPVPPGETGELVHRGPTVAAGYWRDPEATARVFRAHPHAPPGAVTEYVVYSGDYVRQDPEGFLYHVGRRDEQFKCRGFRVNPGEIEAALLDSGLVAEVVVYPTPGANGDAEIVAAVVTDHDARRQLSRLQQYCRDALPAHQQPHRFAPLPAFPRTSSGKIDRRSVQALTSHPAEPAGTAPHVE